MENKIDVFICNKCGYEDSSFIPNGAIYMDSQPCEEGYVQCPKCKEIVKKEIKQIESGNDMTLKEYLELVKYISEKHSFRKVKGKMIKYISHTLDFRTGTIYQIILDGKKFTKVNENRHRDLKKWVMNYLDS